MSGILSFLVTLAILYLDPFGLGAATDRYSKQLFYQLYAPFYDTKGQDHTSVVLVTDATAQAMGGEWPVSYTAHAVMLEAILEERPAALMIDILFLDQRDGLEDLKRVLRENKEKDNIPVYVAAPPAQLGLGASVLDDLAPDVVKFVSVEIPDFYHDSQVYPPFTIQYEKQDRFLLPSAAFQIMEDFCVSDKKAAWCPDDFSRDALSKDMEVIWGVNPPNYAIIEGLEEEKEYEYIYPCEAIESLEYRFINMMFSGRDTLRQTCFYTPTVESHDIYNTVNKSFSRNIINDRVVFYGMKITGVHDNILPPTHFLTPGVHLHAMAMDNLIVYGEEYISEDNSNSKIVDNLDVILALALTVLMIFYQRISQTNNLAGSISLGIIFFVASFAVGLLATLVTFKILNLPPMNWLAASSMPIFVSVTGAAARSKR